MGAGGLERAFGTGTGGTVDDEVSVRSKDTSREHSRCTHQGRVDDARGVVDINDAVARLHLEAVARDREIAIDPEVRGTHVQKSARKHREVERVQARLTRERQFNRKVALNATLRQLKAELEALSH